MGGDDGENIATEGMNKPNGEESIMANAISTRDGAEATLAATAAPSTDDQASAPGETTFGESAAAIDTASERQGVDSNAQHTEDTVVAAEVAAKGQVDDEKENNGVHGNDDHGDDLSSSVEGKEDSTGWADVEAGERTGYSGAEVEPFAVKKGIDGSCIMEVCEADWQ